LADDRLVIHTQPGRHRLRETREIRLTWGIGSEIQTTERLYVIAETYRPGQRPNPFLQARRALLARPQSSCRSTPRYGSQTGNIHDERWFSIGLRLISPRLF
jgi:hypothetical protein